MLATLRRFSLIATLCMLMACDGVHVLINGTAAFGPAWGAFVVAPTTTFVTLQPGQTLIIVVQPAPTFIAPPNSFFNGFTTANPNIILACPAVATIGNTFVTPVGSPPVVQIGVSPIGSGICTVPVNLGSNGSISIVVTIVFNGKKNSVGAAPSGRR